MKKLLIIGCLVAAGLGLYANEALCNSRTDDSIGVAVSPQTFIMSQDQGSAVTVHTAISYATVNKDLSTLTLNGISASGTYADSRGNLVARFSESKVKDIVSAPSTVLTLRGVRLTGVAFYGSDTVRVIP